MEIGNRRILIVDDQQSIHDDYRALLCGAAAPAEDEAALAAAAFLGSAPVAKPDPFVDRFELVDAFQGEQGIECVAEAVAQGNPFALAFVDVRMPPGIDGVEAAQRILAIDPDIQIVLCTAYSDYSWQQITQKLGTVDRFLIIKKPFEAIEIRQAALSLTRKWDGLKRLQQQHQLLLETNSRLDNEIMVRRAIEEKLRYDASHDPLTGLANRPVIIDRLAAAIGLARESGGWPYALLYIDLDRFKLINDTLGHNLGDQLLLSVSKQLTALTQEAAATLGPQTRSLVARLGGDEFTILLERFENPASVKALASRIADRLSTEYLLGSRETWTTASVGVAFDNPSYERAEEVLRDADTAMYQAKGEGKARAVAFSEQMHAAVRRRLELETALRQAIDERRFALHYQPIVHLESSMLAGFEALIRWPQADGKMVSPAEFIPLAEETGLIVPMGAWILEQACINLQQWLADLPDDQNLNVAINLSRRQLAEPNFVRQVSDILHRTEVDPHRLVLEITEGMVVENPQYVHGVLQALGDLGLRFHLDDFGTGHSSLACLHQFPISGLKIDRSFIKTLSLRRDYAAVIAAIIGLAHNLGIEVVAEGIEQAEQMAGLLALETDMGQGYLFGKAVPPQEVPTLIRQFSSGARLLPPDTKVG